MATARDLVDAAMREIGVVAEDEAMTADQASVGTDMLNRMVSGWELQGVNMGWRETGISEEVDVPLNLHRAIIMCLAEALAPGYSRPIPNATRYFRAIQAAYLLLPASKLDSILTKTPSQWPWRGM